MSRFMLAAGVAATALAAPVLAGPGGHGGGDGGAHGGGVGNPHAQGGGADGPGNRGGHGHDGGGHDGGGFAVMVGGHDRGGGGFAVARGVGGGGGRRHGGGMFAMAHGGGGGHGQANPVSLRRHGHGYGGDQFFATRGGNLRIARWHNERRARPMAFHPDGLAERIAVATRGTHFVRDHGRSLAFAGAGAVAFAGARYAQYSGHRAIIDGCPPGLAAKEDGCIPPGQLKKQWGYGAPIQQEYANTFLPGLYRSWYPDNQQYYYRYGDGYAYRVDRSDNFVSGLFPLVGGDYYAPGELYPAAYDFYNVPQPYQSYYPDNGRYGYRYGDGAIYQVDRSSGLVENIVALLTGGGLSGDYGGGSDRYGGGLGGLGIGQQLPAGYDVYNVPYAYRDRYYDTADANYRYADGSIYQVDPRTQVIQQIISALV